MKIPQPQMITGIVIVVLVIVLVYYFGSDIDFSSTTDAVTE